MQTDKEKSLLRRLPWLQTLLASLVCILLGLLVGYIALLIINPAGANEAFLSIIKNFWSYSKPEKQLKNLGVTLVITAPFFVFLLTTLASMLAGMLYSLLLAVAAVNFSADQTLVGTAMNLLGAAAATVFVKAMNTAMDPGNVSSEIVYVHARKALLIAQGTEFSWFMILALLLLIASYVILYKTKFGLRLMACGEHPQAADSVGINVRKMRYAGVMISGLMGGLGGLVYITAGVSAWKFENGVAGFGFLALAVMIFGGWKPHRIALAALLFGLFRSLSNVYTGFDFLRNLNLPSTVYNMMPYIISLAVLFLFSKNSAAPKAEGIPYDKGMR